MDGFDLARNIRADGALRDLPIIMITSRIAEKHREHAMELGVNHYLGKPYSGRGAAELIQHYARLAARYCGKCEVKAAKCGLSPKERPSGQCQSVKPAGGLSSKGDVFNTFPFCR